MNKKLTIYQPAGGYPDPLQWVESTSLLNIRYAAYESLVRYDADGKIRPLLAENWFVSPDCREWMFILRKRVQFHDGSWLTAADVTASIRNASREDVRGAFGTDALLYAYLGGAKIETLDMLRVRITLPEPMADLLDLLAHIMIIPEKFIGADSVTIPGTGPFRLECIDGDRYVFTRSENYWGVPAELDGLVFVPEKNAELRVKALLEGRADVVSELKWGEAAAIDVNDNCLVIENDPPVSNVLMLNCFSGPFSDVRVRQAVNYGTDVDEIIQLACGGTALKLNGPFTPGHFGCDPHAKPYPYDTAKAWQLLAEAGYAEGLELTLYRPTVMPDEAGKLADCLKKQWARIGIRLRIEVQPDREQYSQDVRAKKIHDLCVFDSAPLSTWRVLREKLDSTVKGPWWEGYESEPFNELLRKAAQTEDPAEREKIYREAIRIVTEEAPWVFLYSPVKFFGTTWDVYEQFPGLCRRADGLILPAVRSELS